MAYSVKEIYPTLQGEGRNTGRPAVFCRFAGCNLWSGREADRDSAICRFCDTEFVGTDGPGGGRFDTPAAVADAVASGLADAGIGVQSVAEARGLGVVPLGEERYDFVIPDHFLHLPMVQAFLETLRRPYSRRQIEALGGYDVASMGLPVTA